MRKIKLFCFPYAGGSSVVYSKWRKYFNDNIEIVPVELAGRGRRMGENLYDNMLDAVDDVYSIIKPLIRDCDYAFYGHSMGTVIAFELCRKIMDDREKEPLHLFVSGRFPPSCSRAEKNVSKLPDKEFADEIFKLGGTSDEIFENKEIMDIYLPIIRSDYRMLEEYKYINISKKFDYSITAFFGKSDSEVNYSEIQEWANHTTAKYSLYEFEGNHFFINDKTQEITEIINNTLAMY